LLDAERPALQRLMQDMRDGHVDQIIVYKIDRLTRSLADFSKIVDVLDAAGASFVSVTQSFNTATSMGLLTLNMLLSFAQFEREVTAERIRDKIAASKRMGLWVVGIVFLGYGPAWRQANKGHVSLSQLKVMSAIEACRTEALGGRVAACTRCSHLHITYNSCKNRHCSKCQGPAARAWMQARADDLLPVEYFHVVFTLPAEVARIAHWNKKAIYGLLFKASAKTVTTIAADRSISNAMRRTRH
jgi:hypothetical protein